MYGLLLCGLEIIKGICTQWGQHGVSTVRMLENTAPSLETDGFSLDWASQPTKLVNILYQLLKPFR